MSERWTDKEKYQRAQNGYPLKMITDPEGEWLRWEDVQERILPDLYQTCPVYEKNGHACRRCPKGFCAVQCMATDGIIPVYYSPEELAEIMGVEWRGPVWQYDEKCLGFNGKAFEEEIAWHLREEAKSGYRCLCVLNQPAPPKGYIHEHT